MAGKPPTTMLSRFMTKIDFSGPNGCWVWTASKRNFGYGQFTVRTGMEAKKAHRVSWSIFRGEIPGGMCVLHKCDNPPCVNPDHLFIGTTQDNTQDMMKKGRNYFPKKKEFCSRGHQFVDGNTYTYTNNKNVSKRFCRACRKIGWTKENARRSAIRNSSYKLSSAVL